MNPYLILEKISQPRPNHSEALERVTGTIKDILMGLEIPFTVQEFTLRYHAQLLMGIACLIISSILIILVLKKKPWNALVAAFAIPALMICEGEFQIPLVSWIMSKTGENIIITLNEADAVREIIFCAHIDSKTDIFDHLQRYKIYKWIPLAMVLGFIPPIWIFLQKRFNILAKKRIAAAITGIAVAVTLYWGLVASAFGGYIFLSEESSGAVDNGGSVSSLVSLARDIQTGKVNAGKSKITILISGGEEVGLQGAGAYVKKRFRNEKTESMKNISLVNLELIGQKGNLSYFSGVSIFLRKYPTDKRIIDRANKVWKEVAGADMTKFPNNESDINKRARLTDDSFPFFQAGIPGVTLLHIDRFGKGLGGFHSAKDNLNRIDKGNLEQFVFFLRKYIESYN